MIPHGDRRDFALSGRLQDQCQSISPGVPCPPWRNHVVGVFVERDCFHQQYWRALPRSPQNELLQRSEARQFTFERSQYFDWEVCAIDDLHATKCRSMRLRNQRLVGETLSLSRACHCGPWIGYWSNRLSRFRLLDKLPRLIGAASPVS